MENEVELEDGEIFSEAEEKAFSDLQYDYKIAKDAKSTIDKLIQEWNDLYYGTNKKGLNSDKSNLVMKEIAKQIEWQKPNIAEPFTAPSHPIRVKHGENSSIGRVLEKYSNFQFTQEFDREVFMDQLTDVLLREGTVWVHTAWELEESEYTERYESLQMEELLIKKQMGMNPDTIEQNEDGTFRVTYKNKKTSLNRPTASVERNEHIFPDPSASTDDDCRFIIRKKFMTISEMRDTGWYDESILDSLGTSGVDREDTNLGSTRDADNREYGQNKSYQPKDKARQKITIIQYWGYYDLNGDKIAEPILAEWEEKGKVNLRIEDNPMPSQKLPFFRDVYSARPFSLWGNALAYFIGDNQKVKTGIVRGIMDNMSLANNGQKFVARGTLDYVNFKRMRNGEKHIIVNKPDGITDGSYNNLPQSVFSTLQMITNETEQLAGVSGGGPALKIDGASQDSDGQMTMSQKKMSSVVRGVSNLMSKVISEWIDMAKVFIDNEQIESLSRANPMEAYEAFNSKDKCTIKLNVGTEVNRNIRINQLNLLLQQSQALGEMAPKESYSTLVSEMYELFDMYEEAEKLREYVPQPSPEQQQVHQMEMMKQQLEIQKLQVEIQNLQSEGQLNVSKAMSEQADAQSTVKYKEAQTAEKYAKAQSHQVETALKPAEAMRSQIETEAKLNDKEKAI